MASSDTANDVVPSAVLEDSNAGIFQGLALMWDNMPSIRHRLREGQNLLVHYDHKLKRETNHSVERSTFNVKANKDVLRPVCKLMSQHRKVPEIDVLEKQVQQMFSLYNASVAFKTIQDQARLPKDQDMHGVTYACFMFMCTMLFSILVSIKPFVFPDLSAIKCFLDTGAGPSTH